MILIKFVWLFVMILIKCAILVWHKIYSRLLRIPLQIYKTPLYIYDIYDI